MSGSATALFELNKSAVVAGEYWRLFTGHFTHWDFSHLFWDLSAFAIAGMVFYKVSQRNLLWSLVGFSAIFISLWVFIFSPEIEIYRGLSGIDTALFAYICLNMIVLAIQNKEKTPLFCSLAMFFLIMAKIAYEVFSGNTLFVTSGNFVPLYSAHIAGLIAAFVFYFITIRREKLKELKQ